ncbi:hypothetical protein PHMEG_00039723 [Phytophthora megakarya]|uniref:Eukaryotic/viral aspartic protease n=1 Tax=Phytophthora megakarya TaxID=4795 RepID=A0A225UF19_9STRA|nr:hypothetical protein PHMEG_00039723 [Phytophthora megakarya]
MSSLRQVDEYAKSEVTMSVDLQPWESRGYWRQQDPDLWFKPADQEVTPEVTLAGSLVYFFDIWVGDLTGQQAILGVDFMVPAGIRLDLAQGSISLPDEVRIQLSGKRQLYSEKAKIVNVGQYLRIQAGKLVELPLRLRSSIHDKLWTEGNVDPASGSKGEPGSRYS